MCFIQTTQCVYLELQTSERFDAHVYQRKAYDIQVMRDFHQQVRDEITRANTLLCESGTS